MAKQIRKLCACLLNVSEAHDISLVERIAIKACSDDKHNDEVSPKSADGQAEASVLNIFCDNVYNRSVITIVAEPNKIGAAVVRACREAYQSIDLSHHQGGHPRLGSVDLIPFHPISASVTLEECGKIAVDVAKTLSEEVPGTSFFLFGKADSNGQRGLVERRKQVGWYAGRYNMVYDDLIFDVGTKPYSRYGLTGIGAIPYVMNCNVTIDTDDITYGRELASTIRATTKGGLPGVQSMAFPHNGKVEIACNVEALFLDDINEMPESEKTHLVNSFGKCFHVSATAIEDQLRSLASANGVQTLRTSIVGFSPEEANALANKALTLGITEYWRHRKSGMM